MRTELLERYKNVTFNDKGVYLTGSNLIKFLQGHSKAITGLEVLDSKVFNTLPELNVISKFGVGLDMIDQAAMRDFEIHLGWTGGVNRRSVSELVISFAISLLRHLPTAHHDMISGAWKPRTGSYLTGKTVGIIGCGYIGKDLISLLKGFDCSILVNDILDFPDFYAQHTNVEPLELGSLLTRSDIITLHVPFNDTTKNILSAERLALLKPTSILINTARGGLVDESALKKILKEKLIAAAAFDVFAVEPPEDIELLSLPNFLVTPHIGGSAHEAILSMGRAAINGLDKNKIPDID